MASGHGVLWRTGAGVWTGAGIEIPAHFGVRIWLRGMGCYGALEQGSAHPEQVSAQVREFSRFFSGAELVFWCRACCEAWGDTVEQARDMIVLRCRAEPRFPYAGAGVCVPCKLGQLLQMQMRSGSQAARSTSHSLPARIVFALLHTFYTLTGVGPAAGGRGAVHGRPDQEGHRLGARLLRHAAEAGHRGRRSVSADG